MDAGDPSHQPGTWSKIPDEKLFSGIARWRMKRTTHRRKNKEPEPSEREGGRRSGLVLWGFQGPSRETVPEHGALA